MGHWSNPPAPLHSLIGSGSGAERRREEESEGVGVEQTSGVGLARPGSTPFSTDENADYQNRSAAPLPRLRRLGIDGVLRRAEAIAAMRAMGIQA